MATTKKAASATKKSAKRPAKKAIRTAAKKPYPDNTTENTKPPKQRPPDAVDLLVDDHLAAAKLFKQYEKLMDKDGPSTERKALADKACGALMVHMAIEEEIFYPAARSAGLEVHVMDEANVEHDSGKALIEQIMSGKPGDDKYDAKVKVLGDVINHHVVEEHTEMFPKCRRSSMDLVALRKQMAARKAQLGG